MISDIGIMKFKDYYNLYVGGKREERGAEVGIIFKENLEPEEIFDIVEKIITMYVQMRKKRELFFKF
ncbi:hypothetical protein [Oceanobacillus oncorhynchi]|uniref:hypothetical protein n=2 Tax=Oceanobacillus TaxID=182709 RepID=UPI000A59C033|nr:hypothetical protein [Oceanobacillus oncorhynchi]